MSAELSNLLPFDGEVFYRDGVWSPPAAARLLGELLSPTRIAWQQEHLQMFGRRVPLPRLTAWHADAGLSYRYSGLTHQPSPWTALLTSIREGVTQLADAPFNSVLLNRYRSGADHVSWHSDDEPALGAQPVIASVSFGAARVFEFRHREAGERPVPRARITLRSGSVLIMRGQTQACWQHRLAKVSRKPLDSADPALERVNLTFRYIC